MVTPTAEQIAAAQAILAAAAAPQQASFDGQSATGVSIPDRIAADRYAAAKTTRNPLGGIQFVNTIPGDHRGRSLNG